MIHVSPSSRRFPSSLRLCYPDSASRTGLSDSRLAASSQARRILVGVTAVYLPEIGFRHPGVLLVAPVHTFDSSRTLTLAELIATPEGTDVAYYLTGLRGDEGEEPREEMVAVRRGDDQRVVTQGTFLLKGAAQRVVPRRISSTRAIPPWTGPVGVSIGIGGVGEFHLDARLAPFGPETATPRRDVNASVTHERVTVM